LYFVLLFYRDKKVVSVFITSCAASSVIDPVYATRGLESVTASEIQYAIKR
jgi:hypothetical protein